MKQFSLFICVLSCLSASASPNLNPHDYSSALQAIETAEQDREIADSWKCIFENKYSEVMTGCPATKASLDYFKNAHNDLSNIFPALEDKLLQAMQLCKDAYKLSVEGEIFFIDGDFQLTIANDDINAIRAGLADGTSSAYSSIFYRAKDASMNYSAAADKYEQAHSKLVFAANKVKTVSDILAALEER